MTKEEAPNFSPSYDELLNELSALNSRLTLENIALKITASKMRDSLDVEEKDVKK